MKLNFKKANGLIPAVIQDVNTHKILMLGFMNEEALKKTRKTGKVTFFSRTKKRVWVKGETSGNFLLVKKIIADCDHDTILIKVVPEGPVCHTGSDTCFGEKNDSSNSFITELENIIAGRKKNPKPGSYTSKLFDKGINKIAQKLGEEAVELLIEAKDNNKELFLNEAADLMYHFLVLLRAKNVAFKEVEKILAERHNEKK